MTDKQEPSGADTGSAYLLGQIDANVKHLLHYQSKTDERLDKQDARITKVEKGHWKMAGIASFVPAVIAALGVATAYFKG